ASTTRHTGTTWGMPRASAVATCATRWRARKSAWARRSRIAGAARLALGQELAVDLDLRARAGGSEPRLPEPRALLAHEPRLDVGPRRGEAGGVRPLAAEELDDIEPAGTFDRPAHAALAQRERDGTEHLAQRAVAERLGPGERAH